MQAGIYLRISSDPTGEAAGVGRQREDCLELASALGWEVADVYEDNDRSAVSGKRRPEYERLLADVEAGRVGAIICWHPDRLYRRAVDLTPLIEVCKKANAQIATVNAGNVDLTTPTGRLVAGLLAQVATYEGEHKAERWVRSYRQRREAGIPPGSGPRMFGWTREGEVVEAERETVEMMASDILGGSSVTGLCRKLDEMGVTTTLDNAWQPTALRKYLRNPRLAGHSVLKGDVIGVGKWEPLLPSETWETVRALLKTRSRPRPVRVALLAGLLRCGACGEKMVTASNNGRRVYRCPKRPGFKGCGRVSGYAEPVEEIVEAIAQRWFDDPKVREAEMRVRETSGAAEILTEIAAIEGRIQELEDSLAEPGVSSVAAIQRAIDKAKERLEDRQEALAKATPVQLPQRGGDWPADLDRRRRLVALMLEGRRVLLDAAPRGNRFRPERVRIEDEG